MIVAVPKEIKRDEYRVAMLPVGVEELGRAGHKVLVQRGAGDGSGLPDILYEQAGAQMVDHAKEIFAEADLIVKVKEPQMQELPLLRKGAGTVHVLSFRGRSKADGNFSGNRRGRCRLRNAARQLGTFAAADADERSGRPHEHSGRGQISGAPATGARHFAGRRTWRGAGEYSDFGRRCGGGQCSQSSRRLWSKHCIARRQHGSVAVSRRR